MSTTPTLYFAYGSNMGPSVFRERCPRAAQVGVARVGDHRLGFTRFSKNRGGGVADLVVAPGSLVWGAIFDLTHDGFEALDKAEGVHVEAYRRERCMVTASDGSLISAWTYVVVNRQPEVAPSHMYWRLLVDGAKEAGLPLEYVKTLEAIRYAT